MAFRYMVLKNGWLIFNYGTGIANFRASTGRPGISDPSIENHGPIPPGRYIIIPSEINDVDYTKYKINEIEDIRNTAYTFGKFIGRRFQGDWGRYRVSYTFKNLIIHLGMDTVRNSFFMEEIL